MKIGVIGAGRIDQELAGHSVRTGNDVILSNRRGPASLASLVAQLGDRAVAGSVVEAAAAPVVFLCVGWSEVADALTGISSFD